MKIKTGNVSKPYSLIRRYSEMDGWMDDLYFYILFNSISVISGQWVDGNERLCAVQPVYG